MGNIFALMGPSMVGKTTLLKGLLETDHVNSIATPLGWTTRKPREGEVDGVDYKFVTEEDFFKLYADRGFYTLTHRRGDFFGIPDSEINKIPKDNDIVVVLTPLAGNLRYRGITTICIRFEDNEHRKKAFLKRYKSKEATIRELLEHDPMIFDNLWDFEAEAKHYDSQYAVTNVWGDSEKTVKDIWSIILSKHIKNDDPTGLIKLTEKFRNKTSDTVPEWLAELNKRTEEKRNAHKS